ncbi:hypothetical protein [Kineosporia sp. NBRC 101677]|uniref:hypothetical protein n=1 Tax=Kineosporia sp. NBRC 101677 TaxID=3032197 RepID=UPI0025566ABC|nr:hypothetical protein [Kineosporia sp. NBRC 101677]
MALPAAAATAKVTVPKSATVPLDGDCFDLPVKIQPPSGVDHWSVDVDVANAGSTFDYGDDDSAATAELQHCAGLDGVGRFTWSAKLEWGNFEQDTEGERTFSGSFTIHKAKRTGKLKISDTTPEYRQQVRFKTCVPGPRYVTYKLQVKASGKTASKTYSTGSTGCDTRKLKWPESRKPVKYRLHIPGDDTTKSFTGKWVTIRGHA